jgi:hypothetical protein
MSLSEVDFATLASELAARCLEAADEYRLDQVPDDSLGQVLGAVVRVLAAKAQDGTTLVPFAGNSGVSVTDVAIACTAMMDHVGLATFELGAWQSMGGIGRAEKDTRQPAF